MAFPSDFTLLGTLALPSVAPSSNVPLLIKYEDFTSSMLGSLDEGGGDLRLSSDDQGVVGVPLEVLSFTKSVGGIKVWYKEPSVSTGRLVYVWGNNTGATQPSFTDPTGRNAVWSDALWRYHLDENTGGVAIDSAGNYDGTYKGSLPSIQADDSQKFINNDDRLQTNDSGMDYSAFAITATIKGNGTNAPKQIVSNDDSDSGNAKRQFQFRLSSAEKLEVILFNNGTIFLNQQTGAVITSKTIVNLTYDGTTYRVYSGATQVLAFASTTLIASTDTSPSSWVGARFDNNHEAFKGFMWDAQILSGSSKSADQIATEVDNQEAVGAWFTATDAAAGVFVSTVVTGVAALDTLKTTDKRTVNLITAVSSLSTYLKKLADTTSTLSSTANIQETLEHTTGRNSNLAATSNIVAIDTTTVKTFTDSIISAAMISIDTTAVKTFTDSITGIGVLVVSTEITNETSELNLTIPAVGTLTSVVSATKNRSITTLATSSQTVSFYKLSSMSTVVGSIPSIITVPEKVSNVLLSVLAKTTTTAQTKKLIFLEKTLTASSSAITYGTKNAILSNEVGSIGGLLSVIFVDKNTGNISISAKGDVVTFNLLVGFVANTIVIENFLLVQSNNKTLTATEESTIKNIITYAR